VALLHEIKTKWTGVAGSPYWTTVRHLDGASVDLDGFFAAWGTLINALKTNYSDNLIAVSEPEVRIIESTTGETVGVLTHASGTWGGTGAGDELPPTNQLLIKWQTNVYTGGRRIRGRSFIPSQLEANNGPGGTPSAGYTSSVQTLVNTFLGSVGPGFVIYSPTHRVYASVTGASIWNQWASLRTRRD